jgi:hypothetical protein
MLRREPQPAFGSVSPQHSVVDRELAAVLDRRQPKRAVEKGREAGRWLRNAARCGRRE